MREKELDAIIEATAKISELRKENEMLNDENLRLREQNDNLIYQILTFMKDLKEG